MSKRPRSSVKETPKEIKIATCQSCGKEGECFTEKAGLPFCDHVCLSAFKHKLGKCAICRHVKAYLQVERARGMRHVKIEELLKKIKEFTAMELGL